MVEFTHPQLSVSRQCALLDVARSSAYYTPNTTESALNLALMRRIDECYLERPFYGSPRMADWLNEQGWPVNEKRVARLMRLMGLQATLPGPHTSKPHPDHVKYPYLLRDMEVTRSDQVWCADITYVPMRAGFMYLVAVMDWFSRHVLAWELSNSLDTDFCVAVLERALTGGRPEIFNTDQGSQFTGEAWTDVLKKSDIQISMDGRGRALDNVFIERLWRSVKYENIYLYDYADGRALHRGLSRYFDFYNRERRHSALGKTTPEQRYHMG